MFSMLLVVLIGFVPLAPSNDVDAHSLGETFCADMLSFGCESSEHVLLGPSPGGFDGTQAHGDCRECFFGIPCHRGCSIQQTEDEETQFAYEEARQAASVGDVESLVALASRLDRYIMTKTNRGTIQLLSCDRSYVIANLPLQSDLHLIASTQTGLHKHSASDEETGIHE